MVVLRILIIEDTEDRQQALTSLYRTHAWILVHTAQRAITLINAYDFDIISLDYNLQGGANGDAIANTILQSRNKDTRVVIHSMNPRGADKLSKILPLAVQYPVNRMIRSNKVFKYLREKIDELGADFDWIE